MNETPRANRLHIALFGRRNVGKSSLINALTGQEAALVSSVPGTTTDPVWKAMELIPFGPVVFIDTAGLDDEGELGALRVQRSLAVLARTDLALLVADAGAVWSDWEERLRVELQRRKVPHLIVWTKADGLKAKPTPIPGAPNIAVSALTGQGIDALKEAIIKTAPPIQDEIPLAADLLTPGDLVVLVIPVDHEAPRGRLILPQVQTLREILDAGAAAIVVRDTELAMAISHLATRPALVITDSQAFATVARIVPPELPLTSFSILFARHKGDLSAYASGAEAIDRLADGDRILIAEACTHNAAQDDIARTKLPGWLRAYTGRELLFDHVQGNDFPADPTGYRLVIQCGGCMVNRREILARLERVRAAGVPCTNYGVAIAKLHGILPRALAPLEGRKGWGAGSEVLETSKRKPAGI